MPDYLVRFAQSHESFRKVELQALADLAEVPIQFLKYDEDVGIAPSSFFPISALAVHCNPVLVTG